MQQQVLLILYTLSTLLVTVVNTLNTPYGVTLFGDTGTGVAGLNDILYIVVTYNEEFTQASNTSVSCFPTLTINTKPDGENATYLSREEFNYIAGYEDAASTYDLVFQLTITENSDVNALDIGAANVLKSHALILDATGCSDLTAILDTDLSSFSIAPVISVSTRSPAILSVTSRVVTANYSVGDIVEIFISYSNKVAFSPEIEELDPERVPYLLLNSSGKAYFTGYAFSGELATLAFRYKVDYGENAARLDVAASVGLEWYEMQVFDAFTGMIADSAVPVGLSAVGSLASTTQIRIVEVGQKFPPLNYDPLAPPAASSDANGSPTDILRYEAPFSHEFTVLRGDERKHDKNIDQPRLHTPTLLSTPTANPVRVSIIIQINGIRDVDERSQTFIADFLMVSSWTDVRFKSDKLASVTQNSTTILSRIWNPSLTFVNIVDRPSPFDGKVLVYNTGRVELWQRFINTFSTKIDARKFPFDTQTFSITVRSFTLTNTQVSFTPFNSEMQNNVVQNLQDSSWKFDDYQQQLRSVSSGLFKGYDTLTTSVSAKRIATYNAVNILLPLSFLCFFCIITYVTPFSSLSRLAVPVQCLAGTLGFSILLSALAPPVDYMTRMTYFLIQTYIYSIVTIFAQIAISHITDGLNALEKNIKKRNTDVKKKKEDAWKEEVETKLGMEKKDKDKDGEKEDDEGNKKSKKKKGDNTTEQEGDKKSKKEKEATNSEGTVVALPSEEKKDDEAKQEDNQTGSEDKKKKKQKDGDVVVAESDVKPHETTSSVDNSGDDGDKKKKKKKDKSNEITTNTDDTNVTQKDETEKDKKPKEDDGEKKDKEKDKKDKKKKKKDEPLVYKHWFGLLQIHDNNFERWKMIRSRINQVIGGSVTFFFILFTGIIIGSR